MPSARAQMISRFVAKNRKPPIPIPGYGGYVQQRGQIRHDDSLNPRRAYGPRPQRQPYEGSRKDRPQFDRRNTIRPPSRKRVD